MASQAQNSAQSGGWLKLTLWTAVGATLLILIANSALWVNRYIFNSQNFATVTSQSLTSESSRQAMANGLTDRLLKDYPVAKDLAGDTINKVIVGVLGTERVEAGMARAAAKLNVIITSNAGQPIAIDLTGVKTTLTNVVTAVGNFREVKFDPATVPNEIVLIEEGEIPNFYRLGSAFLWLGPLSLLGGLALLAWPYVKDRDRFRQIMIIQGGALVIGGLLALSTGPLFKPPLLARLQTEAGRTVVGNLYNDIYHTFATQTWWLIGLGLIVAVTAGGLMLFVRLTKGNR